MLFAIREKLNFGKLGKAKYVPYRALDKYDIRDYDVKKLKDFRSEKKKAGQPLCVLSVIRTSKKFDMPAFSLYDLRRVYLTCSNHFVLKGMLSKQQRAWIKSKRCTI